MACSRVNFTFTFNVKIEIIEYNRLDQVTDGQWRFLVELRECSTSRENVWVKLQLPPFGGSLLIGWEPQVQEKSNVFKPHDTNKTRRLADFLSLPVNLHMSTHFSKHILFLNLLPLNFNRRFKVTFNITNFIAGFNSLQGHELLVALTKPWSAPVPTHSPIK